MNGHDAIYHEEDHQIPNIPISNINITQAPKRRIELANTKEGKMPGMFRMFSKTLDLCLFYKSEI